MPEFYVIEKAAPNIVNSLRTRSTTPAEDATHSYVENTPVLDAARQNVVDEMVRRAQRPPERGGYNWDFGRGGPVRPPDPDPGRPVFKLTIDTNVKHVVDTDFPDHHRGVGRVGQPARHLLCGPSSC